MPKYCWNLYNLSHPEKSMILLAPLAKEAGGYEWCKAEDGQPAAVFRDTQIPTTRPSSRPSRRPRRGRTNSAGPTCRASVPVSTMSAG